MTVEPTMLFGVAAVAQRLGVHPETVRRWIREGRLEAVYAGKKLLVTEEHLQAFLEPAGGRR